jgi:hypothetical protein
MKQALLPLTQCEHHVSEYVCVMYAAVTALIFRDMHEKTEVVKILH